MLEGRIVNKKTFAVMTATTFNTISAHALSGLVFNLIIYLFSKLIKSHRCATYASILGGKLLMLVNLSKNIFTAILTFRL